MPTEDSTTTPLAPRFALISIGCFWLFYLAIWSIRGALLYQHDQIGMFGIRVIVSVSSAAVTVIFYLLMRNIPVTRLARSIGIALVLALPAAILYSAINWYMFDHIGDGVPMRWNWSPTGSAVHGDTAAPGTMTVGVGKMPSGMGDDMTPLQSIADQAGNGYFFFIAWAALYLALCYAAEVGALERRTATLRAAAQSAELRALRYQVNPHFLFNTLNSLSSLVLSGKAEQAEQMIIKLATFFRSSLTADPTEDVRLFEEITLQRLYLEIERVRFPDRLRVEVDVPQTLFNASIPGLILQPLVENAVKHAVSRSSRAVTIRISARRSESGLSLSVENDGDPVDLDAVKGGTGVGLRNVRERLIARYGDRSTLRWSPKHDGGFEAIISLPLERHGC